MANYGISPDKEGTIDRAHGWHFTHADLLSWLLLELGNENGLASYLELGVSVGKTMHQLMRCAEELWTSQSFPNLVGIDTEDLNPMLLDPGGPYTVTEVLQEWQPPKTTVPSTEASHHAEPSLREGLNSVKKLRARHTRGQAIYIAADIKQPLTWKKVLERRLKFNILFSDASRVPEARDFELKQVLRYHLLANDAVVIWRGLATPEQLLGFGQMCEKLKASTCCLTSLAPGENRAEELLESEIFGIATIGPEALWRSRLSVMLPNTWPVDWLLAVAKTWSNKYQVTLIERGVNFSKETLVVHAWCCEVNRSWMIGLAVQGLQATKQVPGLYERLKDLST
eukprot:2070026-Amphidinium_carterae.1